MDWHPIDTAPEGVMLLFCSMSGTIEARDWCFVDWLQGGQFWGRHRGLKATHWQPLPEPPDAR